jgi:hypothetical protein
MNFLKSVLGPPAKVEIELTGSDKRQTVEINLPDGKKEQVPLYIDNETVKGTVHIKLDSGTKKVEHQGIKIALVGAIKSTSGNVHDFLSIVKELEPPGELKETKTYSFEFENVERQHESYSGINISLNYFLRVTILRSISNITKQTEFWVQNYPSPPDSNTNIKMEVGIEDCLHIEFEYNKSKYHLKDVIIGKIYFLLVRLKIKSMNISLIKRETTGSGLDMYNENRTLSKFEIMDGAPVKGEAIPVRLFLGGFELTPSYKDVCNKFSVSYIINLVLVDEDDRRYFKQREVVLYRKSDKKNKEKKTKIRTPEDRAANTSHTQSHTPTPTPTPTPNVVEQATSSTQDD